MRVRSVCFLKLLLVSKTAPLWRLIISGRHSPANLARQLSAATRDLVFPSEAIVLLKRFYLRLLLIRNST